MTARQLIKSLQDLGEENLDKNVLHYDEYRYVVIETIRVANPDCYDEDDNEFIGID